MSQYLRIYSHIFKLNISRALQYRTDFFLELFASLLETFLNLLFIDIIFSNINALNSWSFSDMLLLYSMWMLGFAFYEMFFQNVETFPEYVRQGDLDVVMLKPVNPLFFISTTKINYTAISKLIIGGTIFIYAYAEGELNWGLSEWLWFVCFLFFANMLNYALYASVVSIAFWLGNIPGIIGIIGIFWLSTRYPTDIYPKFIRILFLAIPLAFTSYFPTLYLLGKENGYIGLLSPLVAIIWLLIAVILWKKGAKNYTSTGT